MLNIKTNQASLYAFAAHPTLAKAGRAFSVVKDQHEAHAFRYGKASLTRPDLLHILQPNQSLSSRQAFVRDAIAGR